MSNDTLSNQIVIPSETYSFTIEAFDEALRSQGVQFIHYPALRCPVGVVDMNDNRRPHPDHEGCSNGFLYTEKGKIVGLAQNNFSQARVIDPGLLNGSSMLVTFPRFYDNTETRAYFARYDRLYLNDPNNSTVVIDWHMFTTSGNITDRVKYPIVDVVEAIVDSNGKKYYEGQDFKVENGAVRWVVGRSPGIDPKTNRGMVCSIRYTYKPYWYVKMMIHEIRLTQAETGPNGERTVNRMPYSVLLQREYVFENADNDADSKLPEDPRQVMAPPSGMFGPR